MLHSLLFLIINFTKSFRTKVNKQKKDKIQPVLQRFKLRSCNLLIVEQTNLPSSYILVDKIIQHRGSNYAYRYELSKHLTLLSPK